MKKNLLPIEAIAEKLDLTEELYEKRSPVTAKLSLDLLKPDLLEDARFQHKGKLILVTATTPTVSGEGKTVTSIGLVQGLETIGKRAILASRVLQQIRLQ
ncbi:formate--tetrahydrofolate ligase, partial [Silvibacterium sp.]|uniref:formate--tetrahydrofolate ligase n=1 Tax=Silvibacterium sp. TaxID=1964179 RepID=UPI0039E24AAE